MESRITDFVIDSRSFHRIGIGKRMSAISVTILRTAIVSKFIRPFWQATVYESVIADQETCVFCLLSCVGSYAHKFEIDRHSSRVDNRTARNVKTMNHHRILEVRGLKVERPVRRE